MNVFNKVTLQSLKKNKTRTIVTIIGLMLSAAMICAVTTFISSMQNYVLEYAIYNDGDWHGAVYDAQFQDYQDINKTGEIADSTYGQLLGYAKIDSKNQFKPYMYVMGGDKFSSITGNSNLDLTLCVSWQSVVIAVLIGLLIVLISAWIPSKRATKVSAVEAIRQNTDKSEAKRS